jgi:hypothetical protein
MAPGMTRVGFPRYIRTELRDFFYLAVRPAALGPVDPLPCAGFEPVRDEVGGPPRAWRCHASGRGLPRGAEVVSVDTSRTVARVEPGAPAGASWLSFGVSDPPGDRVTTIAVGSAVDSAAPDGAGSPSATLRGVSLEQPATALAPGPGVLAARGAAGSLLLVHATWPECREFAQTLRSASYGGAVFVPAGDSRLAFAPVARPMAVRIFADVEPVPPRVWTKIHREAQRRIDELGLTRHYVQVRHYRDRDRLP